jgi:sigma-B regulation protein RsbU (phosphoserine phosphatase)
VSEEVHRFVKGAEQSDDLTMMAISYTPQRFESILDEIITLKNNVSEVTRLSDFQKMVFEKMAADDRLPVLDKSTARNLRLAIEEAVVNVIDYAYPDGKEGDIELRMMSDGKRLKVMITDSGVPFDPTTKEKADTSLAVEERQVGGLGILLVREIMDVINYERSDGKNILTLIKNISH